MFGKGCDFDIFKNGVLVLSQRALGMFGALHKRVSVHANFSGAKK
jgi:hypothetical protein